MIFKQKNQKVIKGFMIVVGIMVALSMILIGVI